LPRGSYGVFRHPLSRILMEPTICCCFSHLL
jgi:hypothetical protein